MAVDSIITFDSVTFGYGHNKPILNEASFAVRKGSKMTLMGQNGAGKTTLFDLIEGTHSPASGNINVTRKASIAHARQVIPRHELGLTVYEFFGRYFDKVPYNIDKRIEDVLKIVNLRAPHDRLTGSFSGGQQARLLLASALIQDPDVLLLDEPTNNLDKEGIAHLTQFLVDYKKTCLVISHDAEFLNSFTHGVLYLDVHTHVIEQYDGDYEDVVEEIKARIQKENRKNLQLDKLIVAKKEQANKFANQSGSKIRHIAKQLRQKAEKLEEERVDVRKEDRVIRDFSIPAQDDLPSNILNITSVQIVKNHKSVIKKVNLTLGKRRKLHLVGPNGIGKSTLLEVLVGNKEAKERASGVEFACAPDLVVGYYQQDFSMLDFEQTVFDSLLSVMEKKVEQDMRSVAAGFLLTSDVMFTKVGALSEGQKGLLAFARLVLMKPGLLILDEPTNHINFRHIPVIAKALDEYKGAMILVSHVPEFVEQIELDEIFDLAA